MTCQQVAGGYKCAKGVITFNSPIDPTNPLVSHQWKIDGVSESTSAQFQKTYDVTGLHTVQHDGANACGSPCSQTSQLEIADTIVPPTSSAPKSSLPLIAAALIAVGFIGLVVMKK